MSKRYNFPEWLNKSKFDQRQLEQIKEGIKAGRADSSIGEAGERLQRRREPVDEDVFRHPD